MSMNKLMFFVYGTLKAGHGNHGLLADATPHGNGTVYGMQLYTGPGFPYAYTGEGKVVGEIYSADATTARRLDLLEGYPHHYDRKEVDVELETGEVVKAWMYYVHTKPRGELLTEGVW